MGIEYKGDNPRQENAPLQTRCSNCGNFFPVGILALTPGRKYKCPDCGYIGGIVYIQPHPLNWDYKQIPHSYSIKEIRENKMNLPETETEIKIKIVSNGFRVTIGCKELVFKTPKEIADALELYVKDPDAAEKKFCTLGK